MKKILIIIPSSKFRDEEYEAPYEAFRNRRYKIITAAPTLEKIKGMLGAEVIPDITIEQIRLKGIDTLLIIGAASVRDFDNNKRLMRIVKDCFKNKILIGAIGNAPALLAQAGILKGITCTSVFTESMTLKTHGAKYIGQGVVIDNNIITAASSTYSREFARQIIEFLEDEFQKLYEDIGLNQD